MSSLGPSIADVSRPSVEHCMTLYSPSLTVTPSEVFWDYEVVLSRSRGEGRTQLHGTNIQSVYGDNRGNTIPSAAPDTWVHKNDDHDISSGTIDRNAILHDIEHPVSCHYRSARSISNKTIETSSPRKSLNDAKRSRRRAKPYRNQAERETLSHTVSNTPSKRCPYVDRRSRVQCGESYKTARDWTATRHWFTVHHLKEAKAMSKGDMKIEDGTIITSENALKAALRKLPKCSVCNEIITRKDSLKRHMKVLHLKEFQVLQARGGI